ncbi:MAG: hypothetical protein ACLFRD_10225, partial [Nitriliruptoraceae bacterium]
MRRGRALGALLVAALVTAVTLPALAQEGDELALAVRDSSFEPDGATEITVNVSGSQKPDVLEADAFSVSENGEAIGELSVEPLLDDADVAITAALLLDTSES